MYLTIILSFLLMGVNTVNCLCTDFAVTCVQVTTCSGSPQNLCIGAYTHCVAVDHGKIVIDQRLEDFDNEVTFVENGYSVKWNPGYSKITINYADGENLGTFPMKHIKGSCLSEGQGTCSADGLYLFQIGCTEAIDEKGHVLTACNRLYPQFYGCDKMLKALGY